MRPPSGGVRPKIDGQALATVAELGAGILYHRECLGLSQPALAALTGIPQSKFPPPENGKANPRLSTLLKIVQALGLKLVFVPVNDAAKSE